MIQLYTYFSSDYKLSCIWCVVNGVCVCTPQIYTICYSISVYLYMHSHLRLYVTGVPEKPVLEESPLEEFELPTRKSQSRKSSSFDDPFFAEYDMFDSESVAA